MEQTERQEKARTAIVEAVAKHPDTMTPVAEFDLNDITNSMIGGLIDHPEAEEEFLPLLQEGLDALRETDDEIADNAKEQVDFWRTHRRRSPHISVIAVESLDGETVQQTIDRTLEEFLGGFQKRK